MFNWEGRVLDNKNILAVKAALPYLDIPVGEVVDIEGLFRAIRDFCQSREKQWIDMLLNFFMMKRVLTVMTAMNEARDQAQGMDGVFDMLKAQMPAEQRDMFDMMSMMMEAMGTPEAPSDEPPEGQSEDLSEGQSEDLSEGQSEDLSEDGEPMPEIWRTIVENIDRGMGNFDQQ